MTIALTRVQLKMLDFIRAYILEHGISPTFDEIRVALGIQSKGPIFQHIQNLVARGAITYQRDRWRSIALVDQNAITVTLPADLDRHVRALATCGGVSVEAVVIECVRDRLSSDRSLSVSRETANAHAAATA